LALGIFSFDAWQNGDQMNLEISIPQGSGPSEASITDAVAADLFLNEIADIDAVPPSSPSRRYGQSMNRP